MTPGTRLIDARPDLIAQPDPAGSVFPLADSLVRVPLSTRTESDKIGRPRTRRQARAPRVMPIPPDLLVADQLAAPTPTVSILIPAYNEEEGLGIVLAKLSQILDSTCEIVVVDDGSQDGTALVAELHGAHLIRHDTNRGKGAALQTALAFARGSKIIILDADDTYPVEAIPRMALELDRYEMVVGAREGGRSNISPFNRFGNGVFRQIISLAAGRVMSDPLTGMYGFQGPVAKALNLTSLGFGIEAEIVIKAGRMGVSVVEIPITYGPRVGRSKLNPLRDGMIILRTIASLAFGRGGARQMARSPDETTNA